MNNDKTPEIITRLIATVNEMRCAIKGLNERNKTFRIDLTCLDFMAVVAQCEDFIPDKGEALANLTLAYRHLEDASMRLGKTIQALDGGTSCYKQ